MKCIWKTLLDEGTIPIDEDRLKKMGCYECDGRKYDCFVYRDTLGLRPDEPVLRED